MTAVLFGSHTSPYVRLARLVMARSGAAEHVRFEVADPFKAEHRATNPLGRVPALIIDDGPALLETTLIVRTLNAMGHTDLLPKDDRARLQAEADLALCMGVLDLGVARVMESRRPVDDQSRHWQERRFEGIRASFPLLNEAAKRAAAAPHGIPALALVVTADWLTFRLGEEIAWAEACPDAAALTTSLLADEELAATDPRLA